MAAVCPDTSPLESTVARKALSVSLAHTEAQVEACLELRYRVFADELGASLTGSANLDQDHFDRYCKHLAVTDHATGKIVATTRLLLDSDAAAAGRFYSETEFDLSRVLQLPGRKLEIGRTCIHPDYRRGAALALLWHGLARLVDLHDVEYLIGCASVPLSRGHNYVAGVLQRLRRQHMADESLRVFPHTPLPFTAASADSGAQLPTLLKGYLRQGSVICGEPYWDTAFDVADVFVLLQRDRLARRYARHFLTRL